MHDFIRFNEIYSKMEKKNYAISKSHSMCFVSFAFFIVFSICILIQKNGLHSYILTYSSVLKSFKMNLKEMTYPNTRKHILDMVKIISYLVSYVGWNWSCAANIHTIGLFHWITVGRLWSIPSCTSFMIATTTQTNAHKHALIYKHISANSTVDNGVAICITFSLKPSLQWR